MNSSPLHFALRELRLSFSNPRALGVMLVVAVVLGLAGPFGTFQQLGTAARFGYWAVIVIATYGVGLFVSMLALAMVRPRLSNRAVLTLVLALASAIPVAVTVTVVNMVFLGERLPDPGGFVTLVLNCFVITLGVAVLVVLAVRNGSAVQETPAAQPSPAAPEPPALFKRLPLPQRGALCYLTMQDHYVDVVTDRGHALILMRLSDAIAETAPVRGLQIHRSHWIALDAVRGVSKDDGKALVEMSDGVRLPVSRSYLAAAREAGLVV
ncbi:LytTR family DNA-binding domain-containing protein [Youhaiella tibetensis]|uniref:LytTR family DNA-binding domain-containing protein n=1 Tax=Paradevosia tibetensis TaxID=1447062 RepID=UPI0014789938|nr:LytTR family DNA-binding domain-containing protein [Youhaiella tibetensis]